MLYLLAGMGVTRLSGSTIERPLTLHRGLMGTRFEISCYSVEEKLFAKASQAAFDIAEQINQVASDYIADSELLSLSKHPAGTAIQVSPLLFKLVSEARELAEKTDGHFDPTLGPLTKLWRESRRRQSLPSPETLEKAKASCGWQQLDLDHNSSTITLARPGMRLDLGAIAKGQAADLMLEVLTKHGITRCCVTAGGEVRMADAPPGEDGWRISVKSEKEPRETSSQLLLVNCGVSTSGDIHQFIEIDGIRYSHIIDPKTGLGLTRHIGATVIAPTATISDSLSTACSTCAPDQAEEMATKAGATRVILHQSW